MLRIFAPVSKILKEESYRIVCECWDIVKGYNKSWEWVFDQDEFTWTAVGGRKYKWYMRLVNTDGWTDNGEIHKVIKLCLTRKMRNVERIVWGRIAEKPSGLRRIAWGGLGVGFEGWEGCGPLAVLLAPAPIDPTLSWPAGHSPPCFLGHPAQLFGDQADKKGVLGGRYWARKYSGGSQQGCNRRGVFRGPGYDWCGVAAEELSGRE